MEAKEFIANIVKARKKLGMSQKTLAERSGIAQVRVSEYERGAVVPGLSITLRMVEALDMCLPLTPLENELD